MKILSICSNEYTTPPPPDAIQAAISISNLLNEALLARGHKVTTVCANGSTTATEKVHPTTEPLFEVVKKSEFNHLTHQGVMKQLTFPFEADLNMALLEAVNEREYDLVHFHTTPIYLSQPFARKTGRPNIFTLHGVTTPLENRLNNTFDHPENRYVSISDYQREGFSGLQFTKTIYHGIPIENYRFDETGGEHLAFSGRIKRIKGVGDAVRLAAEEKHRLKLCGDLRPSDQGFFEEEVQPVIDGAGGDIEYVGMIDHSKMGEFFASAKAFLFPLQWEEPFGLVLIEAMAAGTPVICFARGSIPEIVKDGETGFVVNPADDDQRGSWTVKQSGVEGIREALRLLYDMPARRYQEMRKAAREHVERTFTIDKMVDNYEAVYREALKG